MMLFQEPGRYELILKAQDVNGNNRSFKVPLIVEELEVDLVTVEERGKRR